MIHPLMHVDFIALTAAGFLTLSRLGGTLPNNSPPLKLGSNSEHAKWRDRAARQLHLVSQRVHACPFAACIFRLEDGNEQRPFVLNGFNLRNNVPETYRETSYSQA